MVGRSAFYLFPKLPMMPENMSTGKRLRVSPQGIYLEPALEGGVQGPARISSAGFEGSPFIADIL